MEKGPKTKLAAQLKGIGSGGGLEFMCDLETTLGLCAARIEEVGSALKEVA